MPTQFSKKKIRVFDIESNGLYNTISTIWCIWIFDIETGERWGYGPNEIEEGLKKLSESDVVVGHNVLDFDLPACWKVFPETIKYSFNVLDTLCLSRFLKPDRIGDNHEYPKGDPRHGPAGHSLHDWGIFLGEYKGDYGETENAWDAFTESMYDYCEQDVNLTCKVYLYLCELAGFDPLNPPTLKWNI